MPLITSRQEELQLLLIGSSSCELSQSRTHNKQATQSDLQFNTGHISFAKKPRCRMTGIESGVTSHQLIQGKATALT